MPKVDIPISTSFYKTLEQDARENKLPIGDYICCLLSSHYKLRDFITDNPREMIHTYGYLNNLDIKHHQVSTKLLRERLKPIDDGLNGT